MPDLKIIRLLPLFVMLLLGLVLASGVLTSKNQPIESRIIGEQIAPFEVPVLGSNDMMFSPSLWQGKIIVLNVFSASGKPSAAEHQALMKLAQTSKVVLYGMAWKDPPEKVAAWLGEHGNPYQIVGVDTFGQTSIPLMLTDIPETFVIDKNGRVAYHYAAPITDDMIDTLIVPLVEKLGQGAGK